MNNEKFSILIPSWNNLEMLKLCIYSIQKNSSFNHQVIIHINQGSDGTLDWVKEQGFDYTYSSENIGVCWALNGLRPLVKTDYIVFANDDMYLLPEWDLHLWHEIEKLPDNKFFLSSTLLQPRKFYCRSIISPVDYGQTVDTFREQDLLNEFRSYNHSDWYGSTWPVNIVHRDMWDLVGGYSVEYWPGLYSDPDFSAKLYMAGVRYFKGISASRVYHFEAASTGRVKKNRGSRQFLNKWGITSGAFVRVILKRGEPIKGEYDTTVDQKLLRKEVLRSRIKRALTSFKSTGASKNLF